MVDYKVRTPVAIIGFNRPDSTQQVLDRVRQGQPETLLLILDGPRKNRPEDEEKCSRVRQVLENIDWECRVLRNYADENMGVFLRPYAGINWIFEQVEQAIILEDDIVPDLSFFPYCDELLERYKDDERILMISGYNILGQWKQDNQSYHFSQTDGIWGWATWRRAWKLYDPEMRQWGDPEVRELIRRRFQWRTAWHYRFNNFYKKRSDSWAYQWTFTHLVQSGLSIVPSVNLVKNIGFGGEATHLSSATSYYANLPTYPLAFPLRHPQHMIQDVEYDNKRLLRLMSGDMPKWLSVLRVTLKYLYQRFLR